MTHLCAEKPVAHSPQGASELPESPASSATWSSRLLPIHLGQLSISVPLFLSPLAGYTNLPFRLVIRELGSVGLCTTDLVNARSLIEKNRKALKLIETRAADAPLAIQLFGSVPEEMAEAARICEAHGAASVDVNMGCPVKKVCEVGGGSAMMKHQATTARLIEKMIKAIQIPLTCKMRLGWDGDNITAPDLARVLEQVGVAALFIHGRTRQQGFTGAVDLDGIRRVVEAAPSIPVIGNGDVTSPEAAAMMLKQTGCSGISVGRGAFYNPWIFRAILYHVKTGLPQAEPSFEERLTVMSRHLELMIEVFGEAMGCIQFRKVGPWYAKRFGPASFFNKGIVKISSISEYDHLLKRYQEWRIQFLDAGGQLKASYLPPPQGLNFHYEGSDNDELLDTPVVSRRSFLPVPRGPNELW